MSAYNYSTSPAISAYRFKYLKDHKLHIKIYALSVYQMNIKF